jgi:hypothetical protein
MNPGGSSRAMMKMALIAAALGDPMMHPAPDRRVLLPTGSRTKLPEAVWLASKSKRRAQRVARRKSRK